MDAGHDTRGEAGSTQGLFARVAGRRSGSSDEGREVLSEPVAGFIAGPPRVVLQRVMHALEGAERIAAVHLWIADEDGTTLRLIDSFGSLKCDQEPRSSEPDLSAVLSGGPALVAVSRVSVGEGRSVLYRYAFPLDAGADKGVAAVDLLSVTPPDQGGLAVRVAPFLPSLTAALAVEMARVRTEMAQTLLGMARDLSRLLSVDDVVEACLDRAVALADASTGSVMLVDEETRLMRIVASRGLSSEVAVTTKVAAGEGIAGWVLTTGKPVVVEDLAGPPGESARGIRSALSVPIADDDGIVGVLNVGSREYPSRFTAEHTAALEALAGQTAVAIRNARAVHTARELYLGSLRALALALETKDPYASGATDRVVNLTRSIGAAMRLDRDEAEALRVASLLHDICMEPPGALGTGRDHRLSTVEQSLIKMHPVLAAEILDQAPALRAVVPIVYHHHEWYNGQGYVMGFSGESIPLGSRILAAADAFVAMTSARPHRPAMSREHALRELEEKAGTQFDPEVVEALVRIVRSESERLREGE